MHISTRDIDLVSSKLGLFDFINILNSSDIYLMSHCEQIETNTLTGRLLIMVLGYVAEMELHNNSDANQGWVAQGQRDGGGFGPAYCEEVQQPVCQAYLESELPVSQMVDKHGEVGRPCIGCCSEMALGASEASESKG